MRPLDLIWQQAQTGDRSGARKELASFLREQPGNVQGWLLLATLLDEPAQQAECYRKALRLDPQNHQAATMLQALEAYDQAEVEVSSIARPVEIPELFEYTTDGVVDEERLVALTREALAGYVVRELGSDADRNTLIRYVCETGDMAWPEAEAFVARVELENEREIAKRRSPFMLTLSVGTLVGGVILFLVGGYVIVTFFSSEAFVRPDFGFYGVVTGLGMTAGGLIGLVRTLKSMREMDEG